MTDALDLNGPNPWQTQSTRVVYDNGRLRLREDRVIQPDGAPGSYTYLELAWPVAAIVPIADDGYVHLVRQWRYPWGCNSWEIPAGQCEPGEDPLAAAQRELGEEVGLQAASWEPLGTLYSSAVYNTRFHLFLARSLSPAATRHARDGAEHDLITHRMPFAEAVNAAMDGRIAHGMCVAALLQTARRLGL